MKKIFSTTVALAVMAIFISSAQAAINIKEATIENGQVFIAGKQAQRRAAISWEGVVLGINSDRDGDFKFVTADLPPDCVGRLKVGTEERDVVINNCTPVDITVIEAGVPKTGQTASVATGDDGDLEKGVASPNPRFTDNGNGTIADNLTTLIWLKDANCPAASRIWTTALNDVGELNSAGTMNGNNCGDTSNAGSNQTDWRLPNIRELFSLVDFAFLNPAISNAAGTGNGSGSDPFSNFQTTSLYWSSTTTAGFSSFARGVDFDFGNVNGVVKSSVLFVIAVRGGS